MSGKSTRQTSRDMAAAVAARWQETGRSGEQGSYNVERHIALDTILSFVRSEYITSADVASIVTALQERRLLASASLASDDAPPFMDFLTEFWDYERSPYIKEKLAHNQSITRRTCYDRGLAIKNYWKKLFPRKRLDEVTKKDLRTFALTVAEKVSAQTVNHIMAAGTIALRWAYENDLIPSNPADGLSRFTIRAKKRDVLTADEAQALLCLHWRDERAYVANLMAMTTGMRAGEIAALRMADIRESDVVVERSWSEKDGFKSPKNGQTRIVPILPNVRDKLRLLAAGNPHGNTEQSLVFWSTRDNDRPMAPRQFAAELQNMLAVMKLGIASEEDLANLESDKIRDARKYWKDRNVVFHSWRHFYATHLASRLDRHKAMMATGHRSSAVFDVYADHRNSEALLEIGAAVADAFSPILQSQRTTNRAS